MPADFERHLCAAPTDAAKGRSTSAAGVSDGQSSSISQARSPAVNGLLMHPAAPCSASDTANERFVVAGDNNNGRYLLAAGDCV
jgi:hypothetical protein